MFRFYMSLQNRPRGRSPLVNPPLYDGRRGLIANMRAFIAYHINLPPKSIPPNKIPLANRYVWKRTLEPRSRISPRKSPDGITQLICWRAATSFFVVVGINRCSRGTNRYREGRHVVPSIIRKTAHTLCDGENVRL